MLPPRPNCGAGMMVADRGRVGLASQPPNPAARAQARAPAAAPAQDFRPPLRAINSEEVGRALQSAAPDVETSSK